MPPLNTDKFKKVAPNTGWQLDASGIANAVVTNFGLVSASALPADTAIIITVDRIDSGGNKTPAKMERIVGVVSGNSILTCIRGYEGTAQPHSGGAVVEIVISSKNWNDFIDGILVEHGQDGLHLPASLSRPIHAATSKATPVDADEIGIWNSVGGVLGKLTWANLKAAIFSKNVDGWISVTDAWAYASADAPTFTITVPAGAASLYGVGMKIKLTQTTVKYFIVTAVADTVLTVYGGTDYTLTNAAISSISYSTQRAPLGFPLNPVKWTIEVIDSVGASANPSGTNWTNLFAQSIIFPIGLWNVDFSACVLINQNTSALDQINLGACLATVNNGVTGSGKLLDALGFSPAATGVYRHNGTLKASDTISAAVKTTYYLNYKDETGTIDAVYKATMLSVPTIIRVVCAYL